MRKGFLHMMLISVAISAIAAPMVQQIAARELGELDGKPQQSNSTKSVPALLNYQGYLATADSGAVNETLAMTFRLYNSSTGGTQLWSETHAAVEVNNGQFYALLGSMTPFPADLFDGSILYLEMEVGGETFAPRKAIVSVAYSLKSDHADSTDYAIDAHHAVRADTASYSPSASPWTVSGEDVYRAAGKVGIGTSSPATELDVVGTVDAEAFTVNGVPIGTSTDTYWNRSGDDIYYSLGNVGIGTSTPAARLQVESSKGQKSSLCSSEYGVYGEHSSGTKGSIGSAEGGVTGQHPNDGNQGVLGGEVAGVEGYSAGDIGVYGEHTPSGNVGWLGTDDRGAYGWNASTGNYGLLGGEGALNAGVYGLSNSTEGVGVHGTSTVSSNFGDLGDSDYGVYGQNGNGNWGGIGTNNYGVYGQHSGGNWGLLGFSMVGVYGCNINGNYGSLGEDNYGVYGHHNNGSWGYLAGTSGARGQNSNGNYGSLGTTNTGAYGENSNGNYGSLGTSHHGVYGNSNQYGVYGTCSNNWGCLGGTNYGAYGGNINGNYGSLGTSSHGVYGSGSSYGVYGTCSNNFGTLGEPNYAVWGQFNNGNQGFIGNVDYGVYGHSNTLIAIYGHHNNGHFGSLGGSTYGVCGGHSSGNNAYLGYSDAAVKGNAMSGYAGYFAGDVYVSGSINKGACSFVIDHPLDPENQWLRHNCAESPEPLVIYRGRVSLDGSGRSVVEMPDYFVALTKEDQASIHLTPVGRPFMTGAEWNSGFRSLTVYGEANREVYWEVLAERDDPVIHQLARPVEEQKVPEERGYYMHPEAYGLSDERNVEWARDPQTMARMKKRAQTPHPQPEETTLQTIPPVTFEALIPVQPEEKSFESLELRERLRQPVPEQNELKER